MATEEYQLCSFDAKPLNVCSETGGNAKMIVLFKIIVVNQISFFYGYVLAEFALAITGWSGIAMR